jgi:uncharacterized membrane protein
MPVQNSNDDFQSAPSMGAATGTNGPLLAAQWEGPLPPPGALKQFDQIIPTGAERIMVMCEKEQAARIKNEARITLAEILIEGGGRLVGALLMLVCLGAAIWSVTVQADWRVAVCFISVPVMGALTKLFERSGAK